jgi:type I restriction-modification system DNA methylase subunit
MHAKTQNLFIASKKPFAASRLGVIPFQKFFAVKLLKIPPFRLHPIFNIFAVLFCIYIRAPVLKEQAKEIVAALVTRFAEQIDSYKHGDYNETQTRRDFIDPFFKALGWDVDNQSGNAEAYREVIHEDKIKIGSATKAPDYSFRLAGGKRLFFVEAKKPGVAVKDDTQPAYQVRRYGWSAKLPISIITDFEEFAVYDCTKRPNPNDKASVARVKYITYQDYIQEFDFLWDTFSKDRVLKGSFDKFVQSDTNKKGTTTVDKEFLLSLDTWRTDLAVNISKQNQTLNEDELNFVVQQTIDRIIFLRIAEDRHIEPYGSLKDTLKQGGYYKNLFYLFTRADEKYNSGLFNLKKDKLSKDLVIENKTLKKVINELYYPVSPYEFSVLSVEILGSAYEQFLGKTILIDKSNRAKIEEKPEVRKAGGVYYTPQYIVDYIVKNTVGKMIEGKAPKEIEKIKIVDPACGSGSFLIGAYQYLLDYHKDYYTKAGTKTGKKESPLTPDGALTSSEKKRILLNNIFGVDIDTNAVEVTKLSLLLKCMEGESETSIAQQYKLWNERILPTLDDNIKSGNSLIDTDYYDTQLDFGEDLSAGAEKKIKPFNWQKAFPAVFAQGGFDAVIGNPPYIKIQNLMKNQPAGVLDYFKGIYRSAKSGNFDIYLLFIEKALELINDNGVVGFINPHKFFNSNYGLAIRKYLIENHYIQKIIHFDDHQIFDNATTYTCLLFLDKELKNGFSAYKCKTSEFSPQILANPITFIEINFTDWENKDWNIVSDKNNTLLSKLFEMPKLEDLTTNIFQGPKAGADDVFIFKMLSYGETMCSVYSKILNTSFAVETALLKKYIKGKFVKKFIIDYSANEYALFPYRGNQLIKKAELQKSFPLTWEYINKKEIKDILINRENGRFKESYWQYSRPQNMLILSRTKLLTPFNAFTNSFAFDDVGDFIFSAGVSGAYGVLLKDDATIDYKYLLGILNSKAIFYIIKNISTSLRGGYFSFENKYLKLLPIPLVGVDVQSNIIHNVEALLQLNKEKQSAKLQTQIEQLQSRIEYHEDKINAAVYQLYGLTGEEIKIIEDAVKK